MMKKFNGKITLFLLYVWIGAILILLIVTSLNKNPQTSQESIESFDALTISSLNKLVFNLPNMDKEMCETFPRVILSSVEEMEGVVDASFEYDGHVVTVYYVPDLVSGEEILNNEVYAWVGTEFISEREVGVSLAEEIYNRREKNNDPEMPSEHMTDIDDVVDVELIGSQEFPSMVGADWLLRNKDNVRVIEIGPSEEYAKGHIEGAMNIDISDIRTTEEGVVKQVLSESDFESLMSAKGISESDRVVIYSSKSLTHASRLYWTFKYYGHENVAIVDGGKDSIGEKLDLSGGKVGDGEYAARLNSEIKADSDYILDRLEDSGVVFLDVRSEEEFKEGRIPGAMNIDWTQFVEEDGTLKDLDELEDILSGVDKNKEIIVYCVSGTRASYSWFVLSEVLGYEDVKLYDGSMIEWRYRGLEIER